MWWQLCGGRLAPRRPAPRFDNRWHRPMEYLAIVVGSLITIVLSAWWVFRP